MFRVCAQRTFARPTQIHFARRRCITTEAKDKQVFQDALNAFVVPSANPTQEPPAPPPPPATIAQSQLDTMHHHIPPAQDPLLHLFANLLMKDGKFTVASKRVSELLQEIHIMTQAPPLPLLREAVLKVSPAVKSLKHRRGGKTLYKPVALNERQRTSQGIRFLVDNVNEKGTPGKRIAQRLALEVLAILNGKSKVLDKKLEAHRLAMVNR